MNSQANKPPSSADTIPAALIRLHAEDSAAANNDTVSGFYLEQSEIELRREINRAGSFAAWLKDYSHLPAYVAAAREAL
jgi:hypothetical protein